MLKCVIQIFLYKRWDHCVYNMKWTKLITPRIKFRTFQKTNIKDYTKRKNKYLYIHVLYYIIQIHDVIISLLLS